jgi:anti-sigma regulatory factor (Ser/Thr protein kinase)
MDTLRLPAKIESLECFRSFVVERAENWGVPLEALLKVELVLEEILTNIFLYAYPQQEGHVEVECSSESGRGFCLRATDWGIPFDPLAQEDPDLSTDLAERPVGGLGIFLARQMADELSYNREDGRNVLRVCFLCGGK